MPLGGFVVFYAFSVFGGYLCEGLVFLLLFRGVAVGHFLQGVCTGGGRGVDFCLRWGGGYVWGCWGVVVRLGPSGVVLAVLC